MKHFGKMIVGACTVLTLTCTPAQLLAQSLSPSTQWEWNKGTIVIKSPERPAGQESVIGLTVPKMNVVRVGFVGLECVVREQWNVLLTLPELKS